MTLGSIFVSIRPRRDAAILEMPLPDHVEFEHDGRATFTTVAPWHGMHDLLVDRERGTLEGIVFPVPPAERRSVAELCRRISDSRVRYCVSPACAIELLVSGSDELSRPEQDWGVAGATPTRFPQELRAHRQALQECLTGQRPRSDFAPEVLDRAAEWFRGIEGIVGVLPGADDDRVEVTWSGAGGIVVAPGVHLPSLLQVELAQSFAEDVSVYRRGTDEVQAFGLNDVAETVRAFDLRLPESLATP